MVCDSHRRVGFGLGLGAQLAPPDVGGMAPRAVERRGDSDLGRLGSPEAALSARSRSRPPGASVSLGQAAAWAVLGPRPHRPCVSRRRHHCRCCGGLFCGACSSNFAPLPGFGIEAPARVCERCLTFDTDQLPLLLAGDVFIKPGAQP